MATDFDDDFVSYFRWIEEQVGAPLRRPAADHHDMPARARRDGDIDLLAVPVLDVTDAGAESPHRRRWLYAGAAVIVAALLGLVIVASSRHPSTNTTDDPPTPTNQLSTPEYEDQATTTTTGSEPPSTVVPTTVDLADLLAPGQTQELPTAAIAGRTDPMVVWTGTRMLVWGGSAPLPTTGEAPFGDGAAYDPIDRQWTALPAAPISARSNAASVWTGNEMLIWGGSDNGTSLTDGAAYDPATETWRLLPAFDLGTTVRPTTVWTGTEMIVLEGFNGSARGGAYNPTTNTWREIAQPPGRGATPYPQAVWTGTEAVMTLTTTNDDTPIIAAYDPEHDRWEEIATDMSSGQRPRLLWTGTEVLAFAMTDTAGGAWNPTTRTWRPTAVPTNAPALGAQPIWTGELAVFWNGGPAIVLYDPTLDSWATVAGGQLPQARLDGGRVWADGILLTWGGFISNPDGSATGANDGIAWRPGS